MNTKKAEENFWIKTEKGGEVYEMRDSIICTPQE
jgi:hypothetical protein